MPRPGPANRPPWRWTDERIRAELLQFLEQRRLETGRENWPTAVEFEARGAQRLRRVLRDHGGVTFWADQVGVPLRPGQDRSRYSDEKAAAELRALIERLGRVPGANKIRQLGYPRLASRIQHRCAGNVKRFCAQHGIELPERSR